MTIHQAIVSRSELEAVRVRTVDGFAALSIAERLAWDALFEKQVHAVPFQSLCWNETWWAVFGKPGRMTTKSAVILILTLHDEIIAFFPMFRVSLSALGIPLLRHVKPMGSDPNLTEIRTGMVAKGYEQLAYAALVDYFNQIDHRWELANLPAVPAWVTDADDEERREHPTMPQIEGFIIDLATSWEAFRGGLKRNIKEAIRKCENSIKRDGIEPVFTCLTDAAAIRQMLPEFYRLHGTRARKQDGVHHPDYFGTPEARSLIETLANDPVKSGIRLFVLKHADRLIAARLAFETPGGIYMYYSGYDPDYGKYSIMTRLVVEALKRSIARDQSFAHLSFGRDVSKTRWSPREVTYTQHLMIQSSLRGRLLAALYAAARKLRWKRIAPQKTPSPEQPSTSTAG